MSFAVTDADFRGLARKGQVSVEAVANACNAAMTAAGYDVSDEAHRQRKVDTNKFAGVLLGKVIHFRRLPPPKGRSGAQKYFDIAFSVGGKLVAARAKMKGLIHRGGIIPPKTHPELVDEINAERASSKRPPVEGREGAARVLIREWETLDFDEETKETSVPEGSRRCPYFTLDEYIRECFKADIAQRKADGLKVLKLAAEDDVADGTNANAAEISELVRGGAYVETGDLDSAGLLVDPPGLLTVATAKMNPGIQTRFSRKSANPALRNKVMTSGLARANLLLDESGTRRYKKGKVCGEPMAQYLDMEKPVVDPATSRKGWELFKVNNEVLSDLNVHHLSAGSTLDALFTWNMINSGQGWSVKTDVPLARITANKNEYKALSAADVFSDDEDDEDDEGDASAITGGISAPAPGDVPAPEGGGVKEAATTTNAPPAPLGDVDDAIKALIAAGDK